MRRLTFLFLVICGFGLLLTANYIEAQDDEPPQYVGSRACLGCHSDVGQVHITSRHALALQDASDEKEGLLADFDQGADIRAVQFPGDEEPRPFTPDDVAFAVGSGRYTQLYLTAVEGEDATEYLVLPARWDTVAQTWQPYRLAENWPDPAYNWTQNCAGCHVTGMNVEDGSWREAGVQCEACHGPGSVHIRMISSVGRDADAEGLRQIRASIVLSPDSQICSQCHSRGTAPSGHPYPVASENGEPLLDEFALVAPDDPAHWWVSGHASQHHMQSNEWLLSGHSSALEDLKGSDAAEDQCLSCHSTDYRWAAEWQDAVSSGERAGDAPDVVTLDTAQYGVTCVSCHTVHLPTTAEGELATGTDPSLLLAKDPYAVCITCHQDTEMDGGIHHPVQEMFEGRNIIEQVSGVPSWHFVAEGGPRCTNCHMPNVPVTDLGGTRAGHIFLPLMPGVTAGIEGVQDTCSACHAEQADPAGLQALIDDIQADTQARLDQSRSALTDNNPEWVRQALDFVDGDSSLGIHNYFYTDALLDAVEAELGLVAPPVENTESATAAATEVPGEAE
jgi:hypothetical protein